MIEHYNTLTFLNKTPTLTGPEEESAYRTVLSDFEAKKEEYGWTGTFTYLSEPPEKHVETFDEDGEPCEWFEEGVTYKWNGKWRHTRGWHYVEV